MYSKIPAQAIVSILICACFFGDVRTAHSQQYSANRSYRQMQDPLQHDELRGPSTMVGQSPSSAVVPQSQTGAYVPRHLRSSNSESVMPNGGYSVRQVGHFDNANGHEHGIGDVIGAEGYGNYFEGSYDNCGGCCPPANDCRDCMIDEDCWGKGLGGLLYNTEYFFGAQGFTSPGFLVNGNRSGDDSSFGLHTGINMGLPLRHLTCGLVSGQLGARVVHSNFNGVTYAPERREQVFVTAGLFRRVDYGLQFGVVYDYLNETWFYDMTTMQIRSDLSWVWYGGSQLGFRFARGIGNDFVNVPFSPSIRGTVLDNYRFYYQHAHACGGFTEFSAGWAGRDYALVGFDNEMPVTDCFALASSLTYLIPNVDSATRFATGSNEEGWNVAISLVYRPRARNWYRWYHAPLLPVADNGSMIIRRNSE